jgi:hypothetical protein
MGDLIPDFHGHEEMSKILEVLITRVYINSKIDLKDLERKGFSEDKVIGLLVI